MEVNTNEQVIRIMINPSVQDPAFLNKTIIYSIERINPLVNC